MECVFCRIIERKEPARIRYEDDAVIVFDNILRWAPVMLLIMPKKHMSQTEMWQNNMSKVGEVAMQVGWSICPDGFRIISNLGWHAMQSQTHGHVHLIGGEYMGPYY